ncbi:hypothetical protein L1049_008927 [Liquidambar formosana]|uniref:NADP-dependent oxidoreductase domain-containing protein n=1 Tax=Liquidambar formosana TaxID=63359 RepID=A0AAP0S3R2_LIQFO
MKKGSIGYKAENLTQPDIPSTWRAMEALYDSGKARAIGVSNFSSKKLGNLLEVACVPPAVNQVECHPSWQQPQLRAFCKSRGVHLSGYSPLAKSSRGKAYIKRDVLEHPVLNMVAEKLGKSPAQVALRWGIQMGHSVLPKSANEARIKENFDVFDWSIPEDLFAKFSDIEQAKLVTGTPCVHETFGAYKTIEELWDEQPSGDIHCARRHSPYYNDIPCTLATSSIFWQYRHISGNVSGSESSDEDLENCGEAAIVKAGDPSATNDEMKLKPTRNQHQHNQLHTISENQMQSISMD